MGGLGDMFRSKHVWSSGVSIQSMSGDWDDPNEDTALYVMLDKPSMNDVRFNEVFTYNAINGKYSTPEKVMDAGKHFSDGFPQYHFENDMIPSIQAAEELMRNGYYLTSAQEFISAKHTTAPGQDIADAYLGSFEPDANGILYNPPLYQTVSLHDATLGQLPYEHPIYDSNTNNPGGGHDEPEIDPLVSAGAVPEYPMQHWKVMSQHEFEGQAFGNGNVQGNNPHLPAGHVSFQMYDHSIPNHYIRTAQPCRAKFVSDHKVFTATHVEHHVMVRIYMHFEAHTKPVVDGGGHDEPEIDDESDSEDTNTPSTPHYWAAQDIYVDFEIVRSFKLVPATDGSGKLVEPTILSVKIRDKNTNTEYFIMVALDSIEEKKSYNGNFFPVIPIYSKMHPLDKTSARWLTGKEVAKAYGLDTDKLINKMVQDSNWSKVDEAFMFFGVSVHDSSPEAAEYLYWFGQQLEAEQINDKFAICAQAGADVNNWLHDGSLEGYLGFGQGAYEHGGVTNALHMQTGIYDSYYTFTWVEQLASNHGKKTLVGKFIVEIVEHTNRYLSYMDIHQQITETTYDTIRIVGMAQNHKIQHAPHTVWTSITKDDKADKDLINDIIFPLSYDALRNMHYRDMERLYYRSPYLLIKASEMHYQAWYTRSWVKLVLVVAAVVAFAFQLHGLDVALLTAAEVTELVISLIVKIAIGYIVARIAVHYAKQWGLKILAEVAAIILVVVAVATFNYDVIAEAGSILVGVAEATIMALPTILMDAEILLAGVSAAIKSESARLMEKISETRERQEERLQELTDAQELLNPTSDGISFMDIPTPGEQDQVILGESPAAFYNRVSNAGMNLQSYKDSVTYFCDNAISLDNLGSTMELF